MRLTIAAIFALVLAVCIAGAQVQTGTISGTVFDPQGAVVPNAAVTVTDNATGGVYNTKTNADGSFKVPGLSFGTYSVSVLATGFAKWETKTVRVITAQESTVTPTLQVGSASEVVTVEAAQVLVDTTSSELVTNVARQQIIDLPSTSRNPLDFATQMAGVTSTGSATSGSSIMNGLRGSSNNLTQDGIDIRDSFIKTSGFANNSGYDVSLESVGEFSISGQNIGADAGDGVVQIRMTTARGSNDLHGGLFYFGRNGMFNANSWMNNSKGTPKSDLHQHRFGGSFSGPVYLPKVYDGRNRTFVFFTYSGYREKFQNTDTALVYTESARQGLFKYADANNQIQTVNVLTAGSRTLPLNPFTQQLLGATPLPVAGKGNFTVDPTAGDGGLNTAGIRFKVPGADPINQYDLRLDHKILESSTWGTHWFEGSWHWLRSTTTPDNDPAFPKGVSPTCFGFSCNSSSTNVSKGGLFAAAINSTMSATMFNEIRFGFNRPSITFTPPVPFPRAFKVAFSSNIDNPEDNWDPQGRMSPFYQISDNFNKLKGSHTLKAGFLISSASVHRYNDWSAYGVSGGLVPIVTLGANTNNDNGLASCGMFPNLPSGNLGTTICTRARNMYSDLTGLVNNISQTFNAVPDQGYVPNLSDKIFMRERSFNFYGQDSWKVTPKLTVNFGVRWEIVPAVDVVNRRGLIPANGAADLTPYGRLFETTSLTFNQLMAKGIDKATQLVPGGTSNKNPFWNTNYHAFAPSLGIAWQPMRRTVIRTGYSLSYVRDTLTIVTNVLSANGGLHTGVAVSPAAGTPLSVLDPKNNQVQSPPTLTVPTPVSSLFLGGFSSTGASPGIEAFDPNLRIPYVQQWTFGIQRELTDSLAVEVRYVGNHSTGMYRANDLGGQPNLTPALLNEFNAAAANLSSTTKQPTPILDSIGVGTLLSNSTIRQQLTQGAAGNFWYLISSNCTQRFITGTGCAGLGNLPVNLFMSNPITGTTRLFNNSMMSTYNALQVDVRKTMRNGLQVAGNYAWAKVLSNSGISGSQSQLDPDLDLRNPGYNRTRASYDIRHTVHVNGVYEFPVGRGRRFASGGLVGKILEGWQTGVMWNWRPSGAPISVLSGRMTVNRAGGNNPAVAVGTTDRQVCEALQVYKLGTGAYYLPADYLNFSSGGSTLGSNLAMLANPGPGQLGDHPLRNACSGPSFSQIDMNLVKKTQITEKMRFEFRAEFFNATNHANFSVPSGNINNTGFGRITSMVSGSTPREIQLNARISF